MAKKSDDNSMTKWCMEWPVEEQIPLTNEEIKSLRGEKLRKNSFGCLLALLFPFIFLFGLVYLPDISVSFNGDSFWFKLIIYVFLVSSALPLLFANKLMKYADNIKSDISDGYKYRFSGKITNEMRYSNEIDFLVVEEYLSSDKQITQSIELLSSGIVWTVNDIRITSRLNLPVSYLSAVPEIAAIAAEWVEPIPDTSFKSGHRELTGDEKDEMREWGSQQWKTYILWAIMMTAWTGTFVTFMIIDKRMPDSLWNWVQFTIMIVLTFLADKGLIDGIITAVRINSDIKNGHVVILRGPLASRFEKQIEGFSTDNDSDENSDTSDQTVEVLPVAGLVWTVNGKPGDWRK
jgi:hypothetical protein